MGLSPYPNWSGGSAVSRSPYANLEQSINTYPERQAGDPKASPSMFGTPGITAAEGLNLAGGPGRGMFAQDGRCWAVAGTTLYELYANATAQNCGPVAGSVLPVTWACNGSAGGPGGHQLMVESAGIVYGFDLITRNFGPIAQANAIGPFDSVDFLGGYGVGLNIGQGAFYTSDPNNFQVWDAGQKEAVSSASNNLVRVLANRKDLWLFGNVTTTVWSITGDPDTRLAEIPGSLMPWGAVPYSCVILGERPFWIGVNKDGIGVALTANGYSAVEVSTRAINLFLQNQVRLSEAVGWTEQFGGHAWWCLDIPDAPSQLVYDATENEWHERCKLDPNSGQRILPRAIFHASAFGRHLVQDRLTGTVYDASLDTVMNTVPV